MATSNIGKVLELVELLVDFLMCWWIFNFEIFLNFQLNYHVEILVDLDTAKCYSSSIKLDKTYQFKWFLGG